MIYFRVWGNVDAVVWRKNRVGCDWSKKRPIVEGLFLNYGHPPPAERVLACVYVWAYVIGPAVKHCDFALETGIYYK